MTFFRSLDVRPYTREAAVLDSPNIRFRGRKALAGERY